MAIYPKVWLTRHALLRLRERTRLTAEALESIYKGGFVVKVGNCRKPGKHYLVHHLFFSPPDRSFFVAILDVSDGAIITLLTWNQYRNHYTVASIGARALREVNRMVLEGLAPKSCWQKNAKGERALVYANFGTDIRQAPLGAYAATLSGPDLQGLGSLSKFWRWIAERCEALELPLDQIHTVTARLPYGDAQEIHYLCA